ncbi:MAG: hypothetical protein NVS3B5_18970 [Sphingomicrobium sp.]
MNLTGEGALLRQDTIGGVDGSGVEGSCQIWLVGTAIDAAGQNRVANWLLAMARTCNRLLNISPSLRKPNLPNGRSATLFRGEDGNGPVGFEHGLARGAGDPRRLRGVVL